jgi:hypothetical protein
MAHNLLDENPDFVSFHKNDLDFPRLQATVLNIYGELTAAKAERLRRHEQRAAFVAEKKAATAEYNANVEQETTDWEAAKNAMFSGAGVKTVTAKQATFFIRR